MRETVEYTTKEGTVLTIRALPMLQLQEFLYHLQQDTEIPPRPEPPQVQVGTQDGEPVFEPNEEDEDYQLEAMDWAQKALNVTHEIEGSWRKYVIHNSVVDDVPDEWLEDNGWWVSDRPKVDQKYLWVVGLLGQTREDFDDYLGVVLGASLPTQEAVEEAMAVFPGEADQKPASEYVFLDDSDSGVRASSELEQQAARLWFGIGPDEWDQMPGTHEWVDWQSPERCKSDIIAMYLCQKRIDNILKDKEVRELRRRTPK